MDSRLTVRPRDLLCAICSAGGCDETPAGSDSVEAITRFTTTSPSGEILLRTDVEVSRARWGRPLGEDLLKMQQDYAARQADLEILRRLDIRPNSSYPANELIRLIFERIQSLEGICCYSDSPDSDWPECPHARRDAFSTIRERNRSDYSSLRRLRVLGEKMQGCGPFCLLTPRTKAEMDRAKEESAREVLQCEHLYIRPHHLMCMTCICGTRTIPAPLREDNLVEIIEKMAEHPKTPVTLVEGPCMVCPPCPAYDPVVHQCLWMFAKDQLKDLRVLRKLGLAPGATLEANVLMSLLYERVRMSVEICGPEVMNASSLVWRPCSSALTGQYESGRDWLMGKFQL